MLEENINKFYSVCNVELTVRCNDKIKSFEMKSSKMVNAIELCVGDEFNFGLMEKP